MKREDINRVLKAISQNKKYNIDCYAADAITKFNRLAEKIDDNTELNIAYIKVLEEAWNKLSKAVKEELKDKIEEEPSSASPSSSALVEAHIREYEEYKRDLRERKERLIAAMHDYFDEQEIDEEKWDTFYRSADDSEAEMLRRKIWGVNRFGEAKPTEA